ncbi:hypothetical protein B0T10DRAFT_478461 [Thelonectria olida]|uniref:Uncharacterized protein n=1 Tax=Thelonectria olida TaxID=1576542 RepID=A0A9P8WCY6_9HYPO|nr:hypothetical protein B0T10DRAFT_478461 [Thelonectria olida]
MPACRVASSLPRICFCSSTVRSTNHKRMEGQGRGLRSPRSPMVVNHQCNICEVFSQSPSFICLRPALSSLASNAGVELAIQKRKANGYQNTSTSSVTLSVFLGEGVLLGRGQLTGAIKYEVYERTTKHQNCDSVTLQTDRQSRECPSSEAKIANCLLRPCSGSGRLHWRKVALPFMSHKSQIKTPIHKSFHGSVRRNVSISQP